MIDSLYFIQMAYVLIFAILSYIVLQQYRLTRIPEFLIMAFAFLVPMSLYSLNIFYNLIYFQPYDGSIPIPLYLALQKLLLLLHMLFWALFFFLGYRTHWQRGNKFHLFLFIFGSLILIVLTLSLELQEIPNKSIIFGIPLSSTISTGSGAKIELQSKFYFGQGHPFLFVVYRLYCTTIFIYAYIKLENPLQYPRFNQARLSWASIFTAYSLSQVLFLISMFSSFPFSATEERFTALFAAVGLLFLGIFIPEGILLPKAQIINLINVFEIIGYTEKQKGQSILMKKTIEYINYVAQSAADHKDKLESISHNQSIGFEIKNRHASFHHDTQFE